MTKDQEAMIVEAIRVFEATDSDPASEQRIADALHASAVRSTEFRRRSKEIVINNPNVIR
jgi:hypothetical protein